MDEPLTNLDAALRGDMRVELKHLQDEIGTTMLYVTHDQTEAMSMGHRIAVMNLGVLQQVGTPLDVYENPATLFVAGFIGDPPMNLVPVRLEGEMLVGTESQMQLKLDSEIAGQLRHKQSGPELVLGVRAEDIRLTGTGNSGDLALPVATYSPLGDQALYGIALNGQLLQVTTEPTVVFSPGETVELHVDRTRMHVFDAATEHALI